jgi:hypothetical protein
VKWGWACEAPKFSYLFHCHAKGGFILGHILSDSENL